MTLNNQTAKELKKDFPIFKNRKNLVYLDSAATSQKPKQVIEAIKEFYENSNANAGRGVYALSEEATELYNKSRISVAKFINSEREEIIFTKSATDSLNKLALVIDKITGKEKNEVVLTEMEHHSNLIPWQQLAKRKNWKLKFIKINKDFSLDLEDAKQKLTDKTAILSFSHISNTLGTVNPAKELIKIARQKNVLTVIDAAQSVPHMEVDVKSLDCDFLVFSGHKMLSAFGIGVLYGKKELLEKLPPFEFGGGMIKTVSLDSTEFAEIPERFEAGTQDVASAVSLSSAISYLEKIGMRNIELYEKQLSDYAIKKLKTIGGIKLYTPKDNSGIISFNISSLHPHDVASLLSDFKICVRAGHHCTMPLMKTLGLQGTVRISFYIYNTFEDIDKLIEGIKKVKEKFGK
jgi:cysteine desulfurase/selenocysteine lyase